MVANLFKTLLLPEDEDEINPRLAYTIGSLQEMSRHINLLSEKCLNHVENNHKPILDVQVEKLQQVKDEVTALLKNAAQALQDKDVGRMEDMIAAGHKLDETINKLDKKQIKRIKKGIAKTRASLLYLSMLSHANELAHHTLELLRGCSDTIKTLK
ncbi:MAG: hypothetical protein GXO75_16000 [Calditrichaeota bacterium]|nr:hypothetical protein [Calditrichota bacterium]